MRKALLSAALALTLLFPGPGAAALAAESPAPSPLPPIVQRETPANFSAVPVYLDGLLLSRAYQWGDTVYVALRPLCHWAGLEMSWTGDAEHLSLELDGLRVECRVGDQYYVADGRYIYAPDNWFVRENELYLPRYALCKLLNLRDELRDGALLLDGSRLEVLRGGKDYYDLNFPMEDVYWLSHIIGSEAGIEPMEGKIGVGNVVMNRVKSAEFPDTVFGVVYDYEHTIQFEPVSRGTIHDDPKPEDIIADIRTGIERTDGKFIEIIDRREAIAYAIHNGLPGDIIVLAGKGHEDYQEINGVRYPMDERNIIKDILEADALRGSNC